MNRFTPSEAAANALAGAAVLYLIWRIGPTVVSWAMTHMGAP